MPAPRRALCRKKTPLEQVVNLLNGLQELLAMDAALKKEKKPGLIVEGNSKSEKECLLSAELVLKAIRIRTRKMQKEQFEEAAKKHNVELVP